MRFDVADDYIRPFLGDFAGRFQHGIGFSDTGRHPEENLQFAAGGLNLLALHAREKCVRIRTFRIAHATLVYDISPF